MAREASAGETESELTTTGRIVSSKLKHSRCPL